MGVFRKFMAWTKALAFFCSYSVQNRVIFDSDMSKVYSILDWVSGKLPLRVYCATAARWTFLITRLEKHSLIFSRLNKIDTVFTWPKAFSRMESIVIWLKFSGIGSQIYSWKIFLIDSGNYFASTRRQTITCTDVDHGNWTHVASPGYNELSTLGRNFENLC